MFSLMIVAFVLGYLCIALEHPLKVDKAAAAILTGVVCWTILVFGQEAIMGSHGGEHLIDEELLYHVGEIAEILFFLLGAMTIVELIDVHQGFEVVTRHVKTTDRVKLLWIVSIVTFFFSAILDNLTTSIVMAALLRKLMTDKENIWFFAGVVVIAANAGGAWSPIGDVTTIMLWIGGQITAANIIFKVFLPSVACLLLPLLILTFTKKGIVHKPSAAELGGHHHIRVPDKQQKLVFWMGVGGLIFVPVFKNITHLPPFMGMLFSLGVLWVTTEIIHRRKAGGDHAGLLVTSVIRRIDTPSVLFFLGILLAVASLQTAGHLELFATLLDDTFGNIYIINILIGLLSAVVDNVPLVAGAMGMYPLSTYPVDHKFWELLAYCAGTGGSALIIGSAAGVAIMGILKIDFIWYLKKVSWLAVLGYFAGVLVYYLMQG
ncbi:MAG: sodium:proton antiporter NhaD [Saprospiraceae bacterium]|nr:sodium:proton antiporter NhaD [Saprospiraceae bacterium]